MAAVDRTVILAHLETAKRYVDKGEQYICRLREIIDVLGRGASETIAAEALLRHVEVAQEMYVSHRDWLLKELKNST